MLCRLDLLHLITIILHLTNLDAYLGILTIVIAQPVIRVISHISMHLQLLRPPLRVRCL